MNRLALALALCISGSAFAQTTTTTSPVPVTTSSVSTWLERFEFLGDLRYRHEYTSEIAPDSAERHQERLRLRFGTNVKVTDAIKAKVRLTTAEGGGTTAAAGNANPISNNQTLTDNGSKKGLFIDQMAMEWTPTAGNTFTLGKMDNPFRVLAASQIIYDVDLTPEGATYTGKMGNWFYNAGGFSLQERAPSTANIHSEPDSWLMAGMAGYKGDLAENLNLLAGAGYHHFTALKDNALLSPASSGNTTYTSGGITHYANDYHVGEIVAELRWKREMSMWSVYFDSAHNFQMAKENNAYIAGLTYQMLNDKSKPVWTFGYAYVSVDKDATVSSLNNSDMASGADGVWAHMFQVSRAFNSATSLTLTWYDAHVDNNGNPYTAEKGLLDLVVSF